MVSALVSGSSCPGRGHCVVYLSITFYFPSASLHLVV